MATLQPFFVNCSCNVVVQAPIDPFELGDRVAAELLDQRVGEHERDHRFADDRGRGHGADVAAFDRRGASSSSSRSTERSGFISVEIGFIQPETRTSSPLVTPPSRPPALLVGRADARWRARPPAPATISSCTRDPGRAAASGPMPMPTRLDRRNGHQRLRQPAVELAVPLHVAAEPDGHAGDDHFERAAVRVARLARARRSRRSSAARRSAIDAAQRRSSRQRGGLLES